MADKKYSYRFDIFDGLYRWFWCMFWYAEQAIRPGTEWSVVVLPDRLPRQELSDYGNFKVIKPGSAVMILTRKLDYKYFSTSNQVICFIW